MRTGDLVAIMAFVAGAGIVAYSVKSDPNYCPPRHPHPLRDSSRRARRFSLTWVTLSRSKRLCGWVC
jgi:hypothetical protein